MSLTLHPTGRILILVYPASIRYTPSEEFCDVPSRFETFLQRVHISKTKYLLIVKRSQANTVLRTLRTFICDDPLSVQCVDMNQLYV